MTVWPRDGIRTLFKSRIVDMPHLRERVRLPVYPEEAKERPLPIQLLPCLAAFRYTVSKQRTEAICAFQTASMKASYIACPNSRPI